MPITYIPASDAVVFRTTMLTRVAEGQEVGHRRRRGDQQQQQSARPEESVEEARRRSRSKSVERSQVKGLLN